MTEDNSKLEAINCRYWIDKISYVNKLVKLLYKDLGECTGGSLHIVLDDGNLTDEDLLWCRKRILNGEAYIKEDNYICLEIIRCMLDMTMEQRRLVYFSGCGFDFESCDHANCRQCIIRKEVEL